MGHIVTTPLRKFATLAEFATYAQAHHDADLPGLPFGEAPFGPIVGLRDGSIREAEYIVRGDGLTRVVAA